MAKKIVGLLFVLALLLLPVSQALAAGPQLQMDVDHIIIVPDQNGFRVTEILNVNNTGSSDYSGEAFTDPSGKKKNGWLFTLPVGFQNVQAQGLNEGEYAAVNEGVQIYKPLKPGVNEFALVYYIKANTLPVTINKKVNINTKELFAVTPKDMFTINSDLLQPSDAYEISGNMYQQYAGQNIAPGTEVSMVVEKAPASTTSAGSKVASGYKVKLHPEGHIKLFMSEPLVYTNPHVWAAYLFIMLGLGIAALILLYRQRAKREDQEEDEDDDLTGEDEVFLRLKAKQDLLLDRIKTLDVKFKAGQIADGEYQETRDKYKQMLVQVKIQLREFTDI